MLLIHYFVYFILTSTDATTISDDVVVQTKYGKIKGFTSSQYSKEITKFLGIPFAKPPVKSLRFKKPDKLEPWPGTLDTTKFSPACIELRDNPWEYILLDWPKKDHSEDCLYLNIYIPGDIKSMLQKPRPVMVYIYGGANQVGNANMYDGDVLASMNDVIVVTFNYRLALFGFMVTDHVDVTGNAGLFDQVAALTWVNENIAAFGGDVARITLFGLSAGGESVILHLLSPLSSHLFSRAIIQSPPSNNGLRTKHHQFELIKRASKHLCIPYENSEDYLDCLQKLEVEDIKSMSLNFSLVINYRIAIIDGTFLVDDPRKLYEQGKFNKSKEVIIGYVGDEGHLVFENTENGSLKNFVQSQFDITSVKMIIGSCLRFFTESDTETMNADLIEELLFRYYISCDEKEKVSRGTMDMAGDAFFVSKAYEIANALSTHGVKVYVYQFDHLISIIKNLLQPKIDLFAFHGMDITYLWGYKYISSYNVSGIKATPEEILLSEIFIKSFAAFVHSGNPTFITFDKEEVTWRPYTHNREFLQFTIEMTKNSIRKVPDFIHQRMALWNSVIHQIQRLEQQDNNMTCGELENVLKTSPLYVVSLGVILLTLIFRCFNG